MVPGLWVLRTGTLVVREVAGLLARPSAVWVGLVFRGRAMMVVRRAATVSMRARVVVVALALWVVLVLRFRLVAMVATVC